jgi:hypothetical protein
MAQIATRKATIVARTPAQDAYMRAMDRAELVFGVGPAGTGKTYLAVAHAASLLERGDINRIILSRPAVEAGERLGFLPGDMKDKVDPYLRPLYDALYDMLPAEAYLPDGRTANHSATVRTTFIIGPDKKIRLMLIYPMTVGRNFDEILRALDAVQLSDRFPIATPANWQVGEDIIVKTSVSTDDAKKQFENVQVLLPYLRKASAPK